MRISDWSSDVCSSDLNRLPRCPASRPLRGPVTRRSAHLPLSSPITATRRFSMSHHRLFAQLAFERALGLAALNALAQAVAEFDQFRSGGPERAPLHFRVLAGARDTVGHDCIPVVRHSGRFAVL